MPSDFHLITRGKKSQVFSIIFSIFFSEMGSKPCKTPNIGLFFKKVLYNIPHDRFYRVLDKPLFFNSKFCENELISNIQL